MSVKINLNIFLFVLLFVLTNQIDLYALVMLFALVHELGHLLCGVILDFEVENFEIMPLGFSVEFKPNVKDYNKKIMKSNILTVKKLCINLAGPMVNFIIIIVAYLFKLQDIIIFSNLIILIINMIPIYPLDGGRVLKNVLKLLLGNKKAIQYTNTISNIIVIMLTIIASIGIYYYKNIAVLFAIIFIWALIIKENRRFNTYNKIYKAIDKDKNYI